MKKDTHKFFKKGFENSEGVRHLSDSELKELQSVLHSMLCDFVEVVDRYGISYSLSGGSVLGAVRHGGFIPWDDDIDINMTRKEYTKFETIFEKEFADKYILRSPKIGNKHGMTCIQIKKKGTVYRSFNELSKDLEECGIYIDIFLMENVSDNIILRVLQGILTLAFGYLMTCRKTLYDLPFLKPYIENSDDLVKVINKKAMIGRMVGFISLDRLSRLVDRVYAICKNDNSKYVTIPSGRKHYFGEMATRECMTKFTKVNFAGIEVNIPKDYDSYMKRLYGNNYMQLPDVADREIHPLMQLDLGDKRASRL